MAKTGDVVTYTLTLRVSGSVATNVQVTDVLPNHLVYDSTGPVPAGGGASWDLASKTLTWSWPSLSPGIYSVTYLGTVDGFVQEGTLLVNKADLSYAGLAGVKEATSTVSMAKIYTVHVGVYNSSGELVKEIWVAQLSEEVKSIDIADVSTITSVNGKVYVVYKGVQIAAWDGTNATGDPVTNGEYYVKVDNVDSFGVDDSVSKMVMVSRSIAKVQVNIYNEAGEIVRHLYSYVDDPTGSQATDVQLSASVIQPSESGAAGSTVSIISSNGMTLVWDGKSDSGTIVTNGRYDVEVHIEDGKGGEQVITRGVMVQSSNQAITDGKVYAKPNILNNGLTWTTLTVKSTVAFTLDAHLYDVAGELLWSKKGAPGKDLMLDMSGLSSGLYFVVTDLISPQGGLAGKQTTQIVIQK